MNAYITGSQAYGYPREDSDIDLVVVLRRKDIIKLWQNKDADKQACHYGKLNLVIFDFDSPADMARLARWTEVHNSLVKRAPVRKEEAIWEFRNAGAELNYVKQYAPDYRPQYSK